MRTMNRTTQVIAAIVLGVLAVNAQACAGNKAPVLVGQSGLAVAQSIGQLQTTVKQLTDAKVIPATAALRAQELLLAVNERIKPLPELLRTVDRIQQAGQSTTVPVDQAIAILQVVGQDLSTVLAGVPVGEATAKLIDLVRASQMVVQTTLTEVAKLKGQK